MFKRVFRVSANLYDISCKSGLFRTQCMFKTCLLVPIQKVILHLVSNAQVQDQTPTSIQWFVALLQQSLLRFLSELWKSDAVLFVDDFNVLFMSDLLPSRLNF